MDSPITTHLLKMRRVHRAVTYSLVILKARTRHSVIFQPPLVDMSASLPAHAAGTQHIDVDSIWGAMFIGGIINAV